MARKEIDPAEMRAAKEASLTNGNLNVGYLAVAIAGLCEGKREQ